MWCDLNYPQKTDKKITGHHTVPGSCKGRWEWQRSWSIHGQHPAPAPRCGYKLRGRELFRGVPRSLECPLTRHCSAQADWPDEYSPLGLNITNSPQTPGWEKEKEREMDRKTERKRSVLCSTDPQGTPWPGVAINHLSLVNCWRETESLQEKYQKLLCQRQHALMSISAEQRWCPG